MSIVLFRNKSEMPLPFDLVCGTTVEKSLGSLSIQVFRLLSWSLDSSSSIVFLSVSHLDLNLPRLPVPMIIPLQPTQLTVYHFRFSCNHSITLQWLVVSLGLRLDGSPKKRFLRLSVSVFCNLSQDSFRVNCPDSCT